METMGLKSKGLGTMQAVWQDKSRLVGRALTTSLFIVLVLFAQIWGIGYAQVESKDTESPRIWTNICSGDIYLAWAPPTILVSVTDNEDPNPTVEIFINNEPVLSGIQVKWPGVYQLRIVARDASGNQSHVTRYFQVYDYITLVGNASTLYWRRDGKIVEAIVVQKLRDLHLDPHTRGITLQVAMCEYLPVALTLFDRFGTAISLSPFRESSYVDNGRIGPCCAEVTPILFGMKTNNSDEIAIAHFVGEVPEEFEIASAELVGWGEDTQGHVVISSSRIHQLAGVGNWQMIVSELNRRKPCSGHGGGGGGGGNSEPCTLPRARLRKRLLERCSDVCQQIDDQPYDCLPCFLGTPGFYCSGHFISCTGAECDGYAEARDNTRPCYASTIGNADDYISWFVQLVIENGGTCPCNYSMEVTTRPSVRSRGYISWSGDDTLALSAGAVIVSVVGACNLQCEVADAVGVGSIGGREVTLGISRGPQGGSGSISIPIRIGHGREYKSNKKTQCSCEGPGTDVTIHLSSAAQVQAVANGPVGALITVSSYAEVFTASNTSIVGKIRCDANRDPTDGKELTITVGPIKIP